MSAAPVYVVTSTITLANAPLLSPSLLRLDLFFFFFAIYCDMSSISKKKRKNTKKKKVFKKEEEKRTRLGVGLGNGVFGTYGIVTLRII